MNIKALRKTWLPPVLKEALTRIINRRHSVRFQGDFATWEEAARECRGYDDTQILTKVLDATLKVKRGEAACERDSVLFDEIQYAWPVLAGLMWAAARSGGILNVLDFGGALGSSYFQNRKFLRDLRDFRWNVVEQAHYVEAGRTYIQDEYIHFYDTIEDCLKVNKINIIILSGVLQCISDPIKILNSLLSSSVGTVIVDRTCFLNSGKRERVRIQHVPESIYKASYPCRFFIKEDFLEIFRRAGYLLVEEFDALDKLDPSATWKGYIFIRNSCG